MTSSHAAPATSPTRADRLMSAAYRAPPRSDPPNQRASGCNGRSGGRADGGRATGAALAWTQALRRPYGRRRAHAPSRLAARPAPHASRGMSAMRFSALGATSRFAFSVSPGGGVLYLYFGQVKNITLYSYRHGSRSHAAPSIYALWLCGVQPLWPGVMTDSDTIQTSVLREPLSQARTA